MISSSSLQCKWYQDYHKMKPENVYRGYCIGYRRACRDVGEEMTILKRALSTYKHAYAAAIADLKRKEGNNEKKQRRE